MSLMLRKNWRSEYGDAFRSYDDWNKAIEYRCRKEKERKEDEDA